ncbi:MAG: shikimate dehydrogenase [Acidimicrobiia bacterium]|nr:MAG: shikimate dehydrogenase [Acidimicrobiia bacterium]
MIVRLAVLGSPVGHSRSPAIHSAAMAAKGIEGVYTSQDVDRDGMATMADAVRSGYFLGASITMPHKAVAAQLADDVTETVTRLGIANTWWAEGGRLWADTTDGAGVRFAWERGGMPPGGAVRILGAGGAAAAAALELARTHDVRVSARRREAAEVVAARIGCGVAEWGSPCDGEAVVNATPIGMRGEMLPEWALTGTGLLDMVYAGGDSPATSVIAARRLPVATGLDMLVGQAVPAFERWFGVAAPVEVMLAAAKDSSAH